MAATVVVESRAGAAGMLAATAVRSPPDGYTVLLSLASVVQNTVCAVRPLTACRTSPRYPW
ncbi:tripartite tricarboxylate transporter substrate-binding protein [Delftia acidovorans]|uniref:tripartite tricarboxylate transporter substrate-binding protein n=1 Tax=Delftia acidovorans TaxID=80866 RepID=UPI0018D5F917|nr:hypothetical protein I6G48_31115 [Delftia acidovorans]